MPREFSLQFVFLKMIQNNMELALVHLNAHSDQPIQIAREERYMKCIARLVGNPLEVDLNSLSKAGPVRIRVIYRDPWQIEGSSEVFVNFIGYKIRWVPELEGLRKFNPKPNDAKIHQEK
ncbi:hypothetical protein ABZP36_004226 [Zizania latifolia]